MKRTITVLMMMLITIQCFSFFVGAQNGTFSVNGTAIIDDDLEIIYGLKEGLSRQAFIEEYVNVDGNVTVNCLGDIVTGTSVDFISNDAGTTMKSYRVLVIGDVNSDGYCNGMDAVVVDCIAKGLIPNGDIDSLNLLAADCNSDGVITDEDVQLLQESGSFLTSIDQNSIYKETRKKHTVTFVDYDGTTVLATQSVFENSCAEPPENPTKQGTSFLGWSGNYMNVCKDEIVKAVYTDDKNVFTVSNTSGIVGDTVTVLVSVDGSVNICGFDLSIYYDSNLELVSYDEDLELDVVANANKLENGIILNSSANSNKTKQRDIIEMTFRIKDKANGTLPVRISVTSAKEVFGKLINDTEYNVVNGAVYVQ